MISVKYARRVNGGTVRCFYKPRYGVWKVLAIYRAEPHKFKLIM